MSAKTLLVASHSDQFCSLLRNSLTAAGFVVVVVDDLSIIEPLGHFRCIHLAIIDSTFADDEIVTLLFRLRAERTRLAILRLREFDVELSKLLFQCEMICALREQEGVNLAVFPTDQECVTRETH